MNNTQNKLVKGSKKATHAELQRRVAVVQELIARKLRESEIIEHVRENYHEEWRVTNNTVKNYIRLAKEDIVKQIKRNSAAIFAEGVMDLNYLYRKAIDEGDIRTALAIRKEKNTVLNVYSMTAHDPKDQPTDSDAEIEEMMRDVTSSDWTTEGKQRKNYDKDGKFARMFDEHGKFKKSNPTQ